ncbi:glycoside hydrolase family 3 N-terminal domain-containing protein [Methylopila sp. 73B]|uniref:glycoside hydrolase family 3 N-terminal domain-containing protein n=1 Tax=Methylopila sp. 73B TaxID=1120792 RepID=UPI0003778AC2|nr:glycoside hydrolase family 3 N-terminal domain-containing protein [Methylopila sp. 73B]
MDALALLRPLGAAALVAVAPLAASAQTRPAEPSGRVEELLSKMTLEEKIGQLNMVSIVPNVEPGYDRIVKGIAAGSVGSVYNVHGADDTRAFQKEAVENSRLKIPLFLALDVIHGYRTIFPTPLAQAASWDLAAMEKAERVAAREAAASGINMIFAPMLDVSRDPRWGRGVEGIGESAWLGARIAEARVRGLQGSDLKDRDSVVSCAKHFGANGAAAGGRDYTASDLSDRAVREIYMPPFEAAAKAGARCFMAALNANDGVPSAANSHLIEEVLRHDWGFDGIVTSDFLAVNEIVNHGVAADQADASRIAINAGTDVDMESQAYVKRLPDLVRSSAVPPARLDEAVRRVLKLKDDLGLFDDPYRGATPEGEKAALLTKANRDAAQDIAEKSLVLLKNEGEVLPFARDVKRVGLVGPLAEGQADTLGPWAARGVPTETSTLAKGLAERLGSSAELTVTAGGSTFGSSDDEVAAAVETARRSDVVVLAVGERFNQSGEAASRAELGLPGDQERLVRAVLAVGKPTAVVVFAGRPLVLTDIAVRAKALLYAWQPGTMGGLAIARTLMGDVAPVGRLPMTFPRAVGQIPTTHDQRPGGRPPETPEKPYTSSYSDEGHAPLYAFGYGLTYTSFHYGPPKLDRDAIKDGETATVSVSIRNVGERPGVAMAQLYLRPEVAAVSQPAKVLRGFGRVELAPGETKTVTLPVSVADFSYWRTASDVVATPGPIRIMTGPNAGDTQDATLAYKP